MKKLLLILVMIAAMAAVSCSQAAGPEEEAEQTSAAAPSLSEAPPPTALTGETPTPSGSLEPARTGSEPSPTAAPTTAPLVEKERPGGVFRRLWADPPTLDPHMTGDTTSAGIVVEVFSGLVSLNTDLQLELDLAEDYTVDDGVVYTFQLHPEAKFHNGKPVTAHSFKWSLERSADPGIGSPVADTYLNDIAGFKEYYDGDASEISGVKVIDDYTLQITIDRPKPYFLAKLTYPSAFVLDRETVESGGRNWWVDNPVGTGPFKLTEYRIGERILLERFDDYYREPAKVDKIIMNLAGGQAMAMYENDEIDITGVSLFDLDRVLNPNEDLNRELVIAPPGFSISYIGFNSAEPPFDDPKFRQALNHAIDKDLIAKEVLSELVVPAYGILPPGFPGYNTDLKGLGYDPDLAKWLLDESAYADPETRPRIVITVPGTGGTIGLDLEVIIEMWKQSLGVEVEIQQVEWATYLDDLNEGKLQAYAGLGWEADYPDPQDFLDVLFHSESSLNHGGYSNPEVDVMIEEARTEADPVRRVSLYHEVEQMIVDDAAWVPLWYTGEQYALIKPNVTGYKLTPMIVPKLREISIESP